MPLLAAAGFRAFSEVLMNALSTTAGALERSELHSEANFGARSAMSTGELHDAMGSSEDLAPKYDETLPK